jgi:hypothetical protein
MSVHPLIYIFFVLMVHVVKRNVDTTIIIVTIVMTVRRNLTREGSKGIGGCQRKKIHFLQMMVQVHTTFESYKLVS